MKSAEKVVSGIKTAKNPIPTKSTRAAREVDLEPPAIPEDLPAEGIEEIDETQTQSRSTMIEPEVDVDTQGDKANSIIMSMKVNRELYESAIAIIKQRGMTQSQFLRTLLGDYVRESLKR